MLFDLQQPNMVHSQSVRKEDLYRGGPLHATVISMLGIVGIVVAVNIRSPLPSAVLVFSLKRTL